MSAPGRLGFFGPAGTFTHQALLASERGRAAGPDAVPFATERETIMAVADGLVEAALVPIENALEGAVTATLDTLVHDAPPVRIVGEEVLAIHHCLAAKHGLALEDVEVVVSHPQGLAQCRRFLAETLPGRRIVAATSTAAGVRQAVHEPGPWAAIGPRAAAVLNDAAILAEGIEDDPGNATRFVWIGAPDAPDPDVDGPWRTSLVFQGSGDTSPGWLVRCLSEFAFRGLNMTKIESRPRRRRLGHYLFVVDLEGRAGDPVVTEAIEGLRAHCEDVRVLGWYPAA